jgi:hypothetical protein
MDIGKQVNLGSLTSPSYALGDVGRTRFRLERQNQSSLGLRVYHLANLGLDLSRRAVRAAPREEAQYRASTDQLQHPLAWLATAKRCRHAPRYANAHARHSGSTRRSGAASRRTARPERRTAGAPRPPEAQRRTGRSACRRQSAPLKAQRGGRRLEEPQSARHRSSAASERKVRASWPLWALA